MKSRHSAVLVTLAIIAMITLVSGACFAQEAKTFPVTGKVLMPNGAPAVGAIVEARGRVEWVGWEAQATATSGTDGKFTLQLKSGRYYFYAVLGGLVYFDWAQEINVATDGSVSKPIEMRLEKGCKVQGSVTHITTGRPVAGMKIVTREGDHAESSDTGEWSMVVRKGSQTVTASKEGYWWPTVNFSATGDTVKVKIETKPGGTVKGRVLDEQGKPIAGASVGTAAASVMTRFATTDADGRFSFGGQDPDAKPQVWAEADGYHTLYDEPVTFPAGQRETQIELTLKKTKVRAISGRVTRPDGTPVKGAKVAYGDGVNYANRVCAWSDKDGKYTIGKAAVDRSLVMVTCKDLAPVCKPVEADKDAQLDFQLKPGHSVEVRVEDESGNPIAEAGVSASMQITDARGQDDLYAIAYGTSDKNGRFRLDSLPEGEVYLYAGKQGFDSLDKERLKVDRKDYVLVMRKPVPGQICGTVVRDSDGKPVTEFNVRLGYCGRSDGVTMDLMEQGVNFQAPDGKFTIKELKIKDGYKVIVTAPGYLEASRVPVMVKPVSEDAYKDTVIRLRPAHSFEGSITAAGTGAPIEGVLVTAWNSSGMDGSHHWDMSSTSLKSISTRTDAAGKFKFDSMPFTSGMIMLEKQGLARTMLKAVSFSRPLQVSMAKGATITGSIADKQGKVPAGSYVDINQKNLFVSFPAKIDAKGDFKITDLPPGEYFVGQYKESKASRYQVFDLKAGGTFHVDWVQRGEVTVEGKVMRNGKPVSGAHISANSQEPGGNWAGAVDTAADGSYKMVLLKCGTYLFNCMIGEWRSPHHISIAKILALAAGRNHLDFNLAYGSITGKLVDSLTGRPLAGEPLRFYVHETSEQHTGFTSIAMSDVWPRWWPSNFGCLTDSGGRFYAQDLKAGEWLICLTSKGSSVIPMAVVKVGAGQAKTSVVVKELQTGSARISFAGQKGIPNDAIVFCIDRFGMAHSPAAARAAAEEQINGLPAGEAKAVLISRTWIADDVAFQVRPNQTASVAVKLEKASRIVFKLKSDAADKFAIGFRITTVDGKPVYRSYEGLKWGDIMRYSPGGNDSAAIAVKPGTYLVKAGARPGEAMTFGEEPNLNGYSGKVTVVAGKDTVIEVPLGR